MQENSTQYPQLLLPDACLTREDVGAEVWDELCVGLILQRTTGLGIFGFKILDC